MHDNTQPNRQTLSDRRQSLWVRPSLLIVLVVGAAAGLRPGSAETAAPDIVARVNGEAVTLDELHRVQADLLELRRLQAQANDNNPDAEELERLAVQKLIQRHLMLQEAGRRKLSVSDDELDEAVTELRRRFADLDSFGAWMHERGLGDQSLIDTIRGDLLVGRVTTALIDEVQITEKQVSVYYEAHKDDLIISEEVRLGIIAVNSIEAGDAILTALSDGVNFRRLAREYSRGQRAAEGGDTGWIDPRTLPPAVRQAVSGLKKGEAYGPVEKNADEFLVVALADRRPVQAKTLDEARHEIERRLLSAKRQAAVQQWLTEQEEKSEIEVFLSRR